MQLLNKNTHIVIYPKKFFSIIRVICIKIRRHNINKTGIINPKDHLCTQNIKIINAWNVIKNHKY
jgi:hypothetical protein